MKVGLLKRVALPCLGRLTGGRGGLGLWKERMGITWSITGKDDAELIVKMPNGLCFSF